MRTAAIAADQGAFLPWSIQSNHAHEKATIQAVSGDDTAASSTQFRGEASVAIVSTFGMRGGMTYDGMGRSTRPFVGGWVDALSQLRDGLDLVVHGRFEADGFNAVPEVAAGVGLGRSFGNLAITINAEYGHGVDDAEQNGAASLALMERLSERWRIGLDSRFQLDLERDAEEPEKEPDWRLATGPLALATFGAFAISAGGGFSALRYRLSPINHLGAVMHGGFGGVF